MKLQETKPGTNSSGKNIADVLREDVNITDVTETTAAKNDDDFTLDPEDVEENESPAPSPEEKEDKPQPELKEDTKKVTDKKEVIAPDGSKTVQTTVTETTGINEVKARAVKPHIMFLMWDIFIPKLGGAIYPDTPKDHWKIDPADKTDLSILISESAKEGDWKGFPTKYFLIIAVAAIILLKWRSRSDGIAKSEDKATTHKTLEQTKIELQAKEDINAKFVKYEEEIEKLKQINAQWEKRFEKKTPYYEELTAEDLKAQEKLADQAKEIIAESVYKGFDLDKIRFSKNGGYVEKEKAGQKGYNNVGVKIGVPSAEHKDVFNKWKHYHSSKGTDIPYFVA